MWVKELDSHSSGVCLKGCCPGPTLVGARALPSAVPACCRWHCQLWEAFPGPSAGRGRGGRGGGRKQAGAAAWGGTGASLLGAVIWKPSAGREGGSRLPGATHAGRPRGDPAGQSAASLACPGVPTVPCLPLGSPHPDLLPVLGSPCLSLTEPGGLQRGHRSVDASLGGLRRGLGRPTTRSCARQHCSHHLLRVYRPFGGSAL